MDKKKLYILIFECAVVGAIAGYLSVQEAPKNYIGFGILFFLIVLKNLYKKLKNKPKN